ncbi:hypothetical protein AXF41_03220 [Clostridium haemolyticum]|uniref:hypothetical protein n=1 Tax=Clostridium haemolyticum TaxID=84025 RepID=UPI0009CB38E8|nr:hypothetical protein [Clostridium haemolyticum]OOB76356.1 hypothetical protein AXF41_03220 [Clostridium haemolyticum]
MDKREFVTQDDFINACEKIVKERENIKNAKDSTKASLNSLKVDKIINPSNEVKEILKESFKEKLNNKVEDQKNEEMIN